MTINMIIGIVEIIKAAGYRLLRQVMVVNSMLLSNETLILGPVGDTNRQYLLQ